MNRIKNYKPTGICPSQITIELDDNDVIQNVEFRGGCGGNTQGLSSLVKGQNAQDVISRLKNIKCGLKNTSCPDQLSSALEGMLDENKNA